MKTLKKLSRAEMKNLKGSAYENMCTAGKNDDCHQYGLRCGVFVGYDNAVGEWAALRCI
ncbi:hypothetical protein I6H88_17725 [Elizabethkingia bruuniana]|uniref:Bacteriocin n=1 Tax=Elizabethkingia bruuniana TaxID=1756149 RepID=A0A7T7UXY0_9FLAO|nr:hypothetical protein [Elizabethkingia bruuniana]QQN58247.1 hypothetical protein I6H88_17725 [Elizabethkingia bruuniana]